MNTQGRYPPELRDRPVRLIKQLPREDESP
jgi:hypothetical protein